MRHKRPVRAKYSISYYLGSLILYRVYTSRGHAYYIQSTLVEENPFIKEKERKERDVLKGLVEEVRALRKEVALENYAEKLKKGLSSS